jgi:hypothetical protein
MDPSRTARGVVMLFDLVARTMIFTIALVCLPNFSVMAGSLQISKAWTPEAQIGGDAPLLMTIANQGSEADSSGGGQIWRHRNELNSAHCRGALTIDPMPPEAASFLRPREIEAVADYVIAHVNGRGEPTFADCVAFFGEGSKVRESYKTTAAAPANEADTSPRQPK